MIEPALHCHRTPTTSEEAALQIPKARRIAEPILDAFGLNYSIAPEEGELIYQLGTARELPQPRGSHSARRETGPDELVLPGYAGHGFSLFGGSWGPHAQVRCAAAAEVACAWKIAGVITDYCDQHRWSRRTDPNTPEPISRALGELGLDIPNSPVPEGPEPDEIAAHIAGELAEAIDSPLTAVILFGSRNRADSRPDSDIDLLVNLPGQMGFDDAEPIISAVATFRK